jgi:predicted alpha/beta-fold hydrolase
MATRARRNTDGENQLLLTRTDPTLSKILPRRPTQIDPNLLDVSQDMNADFDQPIAIVIPGLSSCSRDQYVKDTCRAINQYTDFLPIVMNRRGYSDVPVTGMYPMAKGRPQDLDSVIHYVRDNLARTKPVIVVGLSLGGEYIQYYLGKKKEQGEKVYIDAAISVAALFN